MTLLGAEPLRSSNRAPPASTLGPLLLSFICSTLVFKVTFVFLQSVRRLLQNPRLSELDAVRLVMLYALRYERHSSSILPSLMDELSRRGVTERHRRVIMNE